MSKIYHIRKILQNKWRLKYDYRNRKPEEKKKEWQKRLMEPINL